VTILWTYEVCPADYKAVVHTQPETANSLFGTIDWRRRRKK